MASKNAKIILEWVAANAPAGSDGVVPEDIVGKIPGADGIGSIAVYNILMKAVAAGTLQRKKVGAKFRYSVAEIAAPVQ